MVSSSSGHRRPPGILFLWNLGPHPTWTASSPASRHLVATAVVRGNPSIRSVEDSTRLLITTLPPDGLLMLLLPSSVGSSSTAGLLLPSPRNLRIFTGGVYYSVSVTDVEKRRELSSSFTGELGEGPTLPQHGQT